MASLLGARFRTGLTVLVGSVIVGIVSVFAGPPDNGPGGVPPGGKYSIYFTNMVAGTGATGTCPSGQVIIGFNTGATSDYGKPICRAVSAYWTYSGTTLFYTGGNIAIGKQVGSYALDVAGTGSFNNIRVTNVPVGGRMTPLRGSAEYKGLGSGGGVYGLGFVSQGNDGTYFSIPYTYHYVSVTRTSTTGAVTPFYTGGIIYMQGLAADSIGTVYVTFPSSSRVYKIEPNGYTLTNYFIGGSPNAADVDSTDNYIYLALAGSNQIGRMSSGGTLSIVATLTSSGSPIEVSVDEMDNVYTMTDYGAIYYTPRNTNTGILVSSPALSQFATGSYNYRLAAANGYLFISVMGENRVFIYSLAEDTLSVYATLPSFVGDITVNHVTGLVSVMGDDGNIYTLPIPKKLFFSRDAIGVLNLSPASIGGPIDANTAIQSNGYALNFTGTGKIGVGTAFPNYTLDVNGTGSFGSLRVTAGASSGYVLTSDANGNSRWALGPSTGWGLTGNAGTNPAANYLGTSDTQDLVIKTNNTERLRVSSGGNLVGFGYSTTLSGTNQIALGSLAGEWMTGSLNIGIGGLRAGHVMEGSTNIALGGEYAGTSMAGIQNTAIGGYQAGSSMIGSNNVGIGGAQAGWAMAGQNNTAVGGQAVGRLITGTWNSAFGGYFGGHNASGQWNTIIGGSYVGETLGGTYNTAAGGYRAGYGMLGTLNSAFGGDLAGFNSNGMRNTSIGGQYVGNALTGSYNTALGGYNATITNNAVQYSVVIGSGAYSNQSGAVVIGGSGSNVGIGNPNPQYKLDVTGTGEFDGLRIPTGASSGYVLTSDATGNARWSVTTATATGGQWISVPTGGAGPFDPLCMYQVRFNENGTGTYLQNLYASGQVWITADRVTANYLSLLFLNGAPHLAYGIPAATKTQYGYRSADTGTFVNMPEYPVQEIRMLCSVQATPMTGGLLEMDPKVGSLSLNYLPKWNGSILANGLIFDNGSNVGIGTAAPGANLTVSGTLSATSGAIFGGIKNLASSGSDPVVIGSVAVGSGAGNPTPFDVDVQGSMAYVVNYYSGTMQAIDVTNPNQPVIVGTISTISAFPLDVEISAGYAYILHGNGDIKVFDISRPRNMTLVGSMSVGAGGTINSLEVIGKYLYSASNGSDQMKIFDISIPSNPVQLSVLTGFPSGIQGMDVSGNYAYVTSHNGRTLSIVDITNPASPTVVGSAGTQSHPNGVTVYGKYAYVAIYNHRMLQIFDVSDPTSPTLLTTYYWPTSINGATIKNYGRYIIMGSYSNSLHFIDVANPAAPVGYVGTVNAGGYGFDVSGDLIYGVDGTNTLSVIRMPGLEANGAYIYTLRAGEMNVDSSLNVQRSITANGISIGSKGLLSQGDIASTGTGTFAGLRIPTGASSGFLLTSDASGNARWSSAPSSGWELSGNAGTTAGTNFVGTTDAQSVVFKSNNNEVLRISTGGSLLGVGYQSGANAPWGTNHIVLGSSAGYQMTGSYNTAIGGYYAGWSMNGSYNSAVGGFRSGFGMLGTGNLALGGQNATITNNAVQYSVVIGSGAYSNQSGAIVLAGTGVNVGVGAPNPLYKLDVRDGVVAGAGAYVNSSDARLKEKIETITGALSIVEKLRGVTFDWKTDGHKTDNRHDAGFIAQEVMNIIPNAVDTRDPNEYKMAYQMILPYLTQAIKELQVLVESGFAELKNEIQTLKSENEKLREENASIKARLDAIEKRLDAIK